MKNSRRVIAPSSPFSFLSKKSVGMLVLVFAGMFSIFAGPVQSQTFPGIGDDTPQSMGLFRIEVDPKFQALMAGSLFVTFGYYNTTTHKFQSPVMYDQTTTIGRSNPFLDGTEPGPPGAPVGSDGHPILDDSMPLIPVGFQGPAGTREVHTRVKSFNLFVDISGIHAHVRAGSFAPSQPTCPGEVESNSATGNPALDFPAQSFFDIFVEVDMPGLPPFSDSASSVLFNKPADPLVIRNDSLLKFPPEVVYIHGETPGVPIYFKNNDLNGNWQAGMLFGHLVLAGHEPVDSSVVVDSAKKAAFEAYMDTIPELPLPACLAKPGDANASNTYTLSDVIAIVNYIFPPKPGCTPIPNTLCWLSGRLCRGDWNGSSTITLVDVIRAVNFIFNKPGGPWNALPSGVCCL